MGLRDRPRQGLTTSCSRVALQAVDEGADGLRLERVHSENDRGVRTRIEALEKLIGRLEVAQTRLVQSLERDDDPGGAMFRRIRERMNEPSASGWPKSMSSAPCKSGRRDMNWAPWICSRSFPWTTAS